MNQTSVINKAKLKTLHLLTKGTLDVNKEEEKINSYLFLYMFVM